MTGGAAENPDPGGALFRLLLPGKQGEDDAVGGRLDGRQHVAGFTADLGDVFPNRRCASDVREEVGHAVGRRGCRRVGDGANDAEANASSNLDLHNYGIFTSIDVSFTSSDYEQAFNDSTPPPPCRRPDHLHRVLLVT